MKDPNVLSHWYLLMEDFKTSALNFYDSIEESIGRRSVPDLKVSRVTYKEGGLATAKREYLRIQRGSLTFDICAAPYGNGFFFSWWLARAPGKHALLALAGLLFGSLLVYSVLWQIMGFLWSTLVMPALFVLLGLLIREGAIPGEELVLEIPVVGWLYERIFSPTTYYKLDTALMFQESVRNAVMEVVGEVRSEKGLRALSEDEARPKLRTLASA